MPAVKGSPPTLRQEKAELTRARIRDAARRLFAGRGYGATTLVSIARDAGVAVQTVYAVYGSKAAILRSLRDAVLSDPVADALYEEALAGGSAREKLDLLARSVRSRWQAGYDVVAVNETAAATDPTLRREVDAVLARRRSALERLARSLQRELAAGVGVARASAMLDAATLPAVYAALVVEHGWSADEYEAWLANVLRRSLLGP